MTTIGMFDSGVGGLSVLAESRRLMPGPTFVYLADQAYGPYGDRSLDEVRRRSDRIARYLIGYGAEMIVVACHTASAAALHYLRDRHPKVPIVGIEPAVKPAVEGSRTGSIGVMATTATFQGELFSSVVERFAGNARVIARPCPGLADLVETGASPATIKAALVGHLRPFRDRNVDRIVLGCTHYSFIGDLIGDLSGVDVVDPAPPVARQVARVAEQNGLTGAGLGSTEMLTTGDPIRFQRRATSLLGEVVTVTRIEI